MKNVEMFDGSDEMMDKYYMNRFLNWDKNGRKYYEYYLLDINDEEVEVYMYDLIADDGQENFWIEKRGESKEGPILDYLDLRD